MKRSSSPNSIGRLWGRGTAVAATMWIAAIAVLVASLEPKAIEHRDAVKAVVVEPPLAGPVPMSRQLSSSNHDQDGQNVIYGDGPEIPFPNPFMGMQHDRIFTGRYGTATAAGTNPFVGTQHDDTIDGRYRTATMSGAATQQYDGPDTILLPTVN